MHFNVLKFRVSDGCTSASCTLLPLAASRAASALARKVQANPAGARAGTLGSLAVMSRTGAELAAFVDAHAADAGAVAAASRVALLSLDSALLPVDALAQHGRKAFAAVQAWVG